MRQPTLAQLEAFLREVDGDFPVPLSQKQDLSAFAQKLMEKGTLCCVMEDDRILAMAAGYTRNLSENLAYLSVAAVLRSHRGRGLGAKTVQSFLQCSREAGAVGVHLYAVADNAPAMAMYRRLGFTLWQRETEPRPEDAHLICCFD